MVLAQIGVSINGVSTKRC